MVESWRFIDRRAGRRGNRRAKVFMSGPPAAPNNNSSTAQHLCQPSPTAVVRHAATDVRYCRPMFLPNPIEGETIARNITQESSLGNFAAGARTRCPTRSLLDKISARDAAEPNPASAMGTADYQPISHARACRGGAGIAR